MEEYEEFGLTKNESKVYEALVKFGKLGAGEISGKADVSYSKIYNVIGSLVNKGLVSVIPEKTKKFVPTDPEALVKLIEKKQEKLEKDRKKAKEMKQFYEVKEKNPVIMAFGRKGFYKIARELKLEVSEKQPFPGPGLAIRIVGEATPNRTQIVREACFIVEKEIELAVKREQMEKPWQYFAVLLPLKSVGVHGDKRAYGYVIAVRAVHSIDAMTCAFSKIPDEVIESISTKITNSMKDKVNRVVYDVTNKPPATVEWE